MDRGIIRVPSQTVDGQRISAVGAFTAIARLIAMSGLQLDPDAIVAAFFCACSETFFVRTHRVMSDYCSPYAQRDSGRDRRLALFYASCSAARRDGKTAARMGGGLVVAASGQSMML
jgi:hypothetical protein